MFARGLCYSPDPGMERYSEPFVHFVKDGFLSLGGMKRIREVYERGVFRELHTDLYRFLQTDELGMLDELGFFRDCLMEVFKEMVNVDGGWIVTFGSYYRKGDYLLCHDDRVENRRLAYTFYLDDYESGELILYERDCVTESKRIETRSNRLVVFEVTDASFHEVGYCRIDGRRAFTGWLNFRGITHESRRETAPLHVLASYEEVPFEVDFGEGSVLFYPGMGYDFESVSAEVEGPFYSRRVERLELARPVVLDVEGWTLVEGNFYHFRVGDYILLNDRCNEKMDGEIYDVFLMRCGVARDADDSHVGLDDPTNPIKYLDSNGGFVFGLPVEDQNMFVVKRNRLCLFVERTENEFSLAHLVYRG